MHSKSNIREVKASKNDADSKDNGEANEVASLSELNDIQMVQCKNKCPEDMMNKYKIGESGA